MLCRERESWNSKRVGVLLDFIGGRLTGPGCTEAVYLERQPHHSRFGLLMQAQNGLLSRCPDGAGKVNQHRAGFFKP